MFEAFLRNVMQATPRVGGAADERRAACSPQDARSGREGGAMSLRILHVLDHSIPLQSGYTFRTLRSCASSGAWAGRRSI